MFGINPVEMAKGELLKADLDNNKVPDVFQALDAAEAGMGALAGFVKEFDEEEVMAALYMFESVRKPENRRKKEELAAIAKQVKAIPAGLEAAKQALETFEAGLKAGKKK